MANVVSIVLLTEMELARSECAELVLALLEEHAPTLMPDRFGSHEPLKGRFDEQGAKGFAATWAGSHSTFWVSRNRKAKGALLHSYYPQHEQLFMRALYAKEARETHDLKSLFLALNEAFRPDLAGLHINTTLEVEGIPVFGRGDALGVHANTFTILKGLPRPWWSTHFGRPYVDMFGKPRLAAAPCSAVTWGPYEDATLQLTPQLDDCVDDRDQVEAARDRMRDYLGGTCVPDFPGVDEWLRERQRRADMAQRGEVITPLPKMPRPY